MGGDRGQGADGLTGRSSTTVPPRGHISGRITASTPRSNEITANREAVIKRGLSQIS